MTGTISPIFVSYSEDDGDDFAIAIKKNFFKWNYDVFVARRDIPVGENWDKLIKKKLTDSKTFILLITEGALRSDYVNIEVTEAQKYKKDFVPCRFEDVQRKDIKWELNEKQMITFENTSDLLRKLAKHFRDTEGRTQGIGQALTIRTDKASYKPGDKIKVMGTVPAIIKGVPIVIQVFNPSHKPILIEQPNPDTDGTYSFNFILGEQSVGGIYKIKAMYVGQSVQAEFEFTALRAVPVQTVEYEKTKFPITTSLSNGNIENFEVDQDNTSIIISVSTPEEDGELTITLPRHLIDARIDGRDDEFIVLVDGEEATADETATTSTERTLTIAIPKNSTEVEIIGTVVFPTEEVEEQISVVLIPMGASDVSNRHFYIPKEITIQKGTKVIWVNGDSAGHTVTSGKPGDSDAGSLFDSGFPLIGAGVTFEERFDKRGEFAYFCQVHPHMIGKVKVV